MVEKIAKKDANRHAPAIFVGDHWHADHESTTGWLQSNRKRVRRRSPLSGSWQVVFASTVLLG